jgi:Putative transposase
MKPANSRFFTHLYKCGKLQFHGSLMKIAGVIAFNRFIQPLRNKDWVVYAKPPFGGPEQVLKYLARYTHRVAISNSRLVDFRDGNVPFLWRDYAHGGKQKVMTISAHEFLRRFLLHVLLAAWSVSGILVCSQTAGADLLWLAAGLYSTSRLPIRCPRHPCVVRRAPASW